MGMLERLIGLLRPKICFSQTKLGQGGPELVALSQPLRYITIE